MTYTEMLFEAIGDRNPQEVLRSTPAQLRAVTATVDEATLRRPEREGKWSMLQVVQHLADSEIVCGWRYRLVLAQDGSPIAGYDQDLWMSQLWRGDERLDDVLAQFDGVRAANVRLLVRLRPEEWERAGIHSERGRETVRHMTKLFAAHDLVHLRQLERVRKAVA